MIEINSLGIEGKKAFGLGILFSFDNFKGISIMLGTLVINIGTRRS